MNTNKKIVAVEDRLAILPAARRNLRGGRYNLANGESGQVVLRAAGPEESESIILEIVLPGIASAQIRQVLENDQVTVQIPIIRLTTKLEKADRLDGLTLANDRNVPRPFHSRELIFSAHSPQHRGEEKSVPNERLVHGDLLLDRTRHEVSLQGEPIDLTSTEFKLLFVLMRKRGQVLDRERLLNEVWGYESLIDTRTVDTHIKRLREKLGKAASFIETVRGVGYRMTEN
jgi:two-component system phosphate regulon response regulator PhoB